MQSSDNLLYAPVKVARAILMLLLAPIVLHITVLAQDSGTTLHFQTSKGLKIIINEGRISVNGHVSSKPRVEGIIYSSPRNKIVENGGTVFLFLEVNGSPNLDKLNVYKVTDTGVLFIANAMSSDVADLDGDGFLEFGGRDLTEMHPSEDSMYYIPYAYYEIRDGKINYDTALSREMDLRVNYVYLSDPGDAHGNCCLAIVKPAKRKISHFSLVHPDILSERIDGPANVRDTVNGRILFQLNNNIPVFTTDTNNRWCRIGLKVFLSEDEYKAQIIPRGTRLWSNGVESGVTMADVRFFGEDAYKDYDGFTLDLMGYTSMQNVRQETQPENILSRIIGGQGTTTLAEYADFIKGFQFFKSTMGGFSVYQLDGGFVYGPSAPLRLLLVFQNDTLLGVVHLRKLGPSPYKELKLHHHYNFAVIGDPDDAIISDFQHLFNSFIDRAG